MSKTFHAPAFPVSDLQNDEDYNGLTQRQYFAAHAPAIPDWFDIVRATPMPQRPDPSQLDAGDRQQFNSLRNGTLAETSASLPALALYREDLAAVKALNEWHQQGFAEIYFAWRWFYADQMLATGGAA